MNPEEREELRNLLPGAGDPVLTRERHDMLKDHLMKEIAQMVQDAQERAAVPTARKRASRRRFALLGLPLAMTVAIAAAVAVDVLVPAAPATDQEAVELLDRIAVAAAAQKPVTVRDNQYIYVSTQGTLEITGVKDNGTQVFRRTDWTSVDGKRPGLARITVLSGPNLPGHRTPKGSPADMKLAADPNVTTYRELEALPTDPDALLEKVYADTKDGGSINREAALEAIGDMLADAVLLPELDAALYRAAAKIPGVSVVGKAKDLAGRRGIGLSFGNDGDRETWVFDKKSLRYLGSNETALFGAGVVDTAGQTPGKQQRGF
ncbi:CU044_5270 family protein [Streptomyces tendae]|uniref:CU044_5270 family protein n=1 Tax=Streptomyces tendae TaxID=1932 RepID=UPI0037BCE844